MSRFSDVADKINVSQEEEKIFLYWNEINAFETSLKLSEGRPEYTFYDGPPFATGLPHYGHILAGTIKDTGWIRLVIIQLIFLTYMKIHDLTFY
jgi:isoleucyl-tRNA synthetase